MDILLKLACKWLTSWLQLMFFKVGYDSLYTIQNQIPEEEHECLQFL